MSQSESKPVAAIIGVGPGLGASLARRFAEKYAVAINARTLDYLRTLANDIRGRGGAALEVQANIGNVDEVHRALESIRTQLGEPQVLLFNAAAGPFGNVNEVTAEQFENSMRVNALGAFLCAKECVPSMIKRATASSCSPVQPPVSKRARAQSHLAQGISPNVALHNPWLATWGRRAFT